MTAWRKQLPAIARTVFGALSLACAVVAPITAEAAGLPDGFVYLRDVAPGIAEDMRYAGPRNFTGQTVSGYLAPFCVLTREAANALKAAHDGLAPLGLGLKVYDCYRPQKATEAFRSWAGAVEDGRTRDEYFPGLERRKLFGTGYISSRSAHSRGSTVDVTLVPLDAAPVKWSTSTRYGPCTAPLGQRAPDSSLDMGSGYDCFSDMSATDYRDLPEIARDNRALLAIVMQAAGFVPYAREWWHFELKSEPFPKTSFDFDVVAPGTVAEATPPPAEAAPPPNLAVAETADSQPAAEPTQASVAATASIDTDQQPAPVQSAPVQPVAAANQPRALDVVCVGGGQNLNVRKTPELRGAIAGSVPVTNPVLVEMDCGAPDALERYHELARTKGARWQDGPWCKVRFATSGDTPDQDGYVLGSFVYPRGVAGARCNS